MNPIAAVGDNCIDRYLPPLGHCLVGGNAVNVAVQLSALGREVHYFGAVGSDRAGRLVRDALADHGVGIEHLVTCQGLPTAYTDIATGEDGDRHFVHEEFGACAAYSPSPSDIEALRHMRHVHIGWLNGASNLRRALAHAAATVSQDLTVNNSLENLSPAGLDIAFCSAAAAQGELQLQHLLDAGARLAVVTLGAAGSLAGDDRHFAMVAAPAITPLDTTGAGDAFIAGFIDAHVAGRELRECLLHASTRAAMACLHRGGFPQPPIEGLLTQS